MVAANPQDSISWLRQRPTATLLALALAATVAIAFAYWPGLAGPFLFDDLDSIGDLGKYGGVHDWHTASQFIFGGTSGPTGRPLSLVTFLIDGRDWPTDPWPFKRTNLVIHVLNAALLGTFLWQALRILGVASGKAVGVACAATLAWALHPFLVSTVLYPVQRMAQLATLFVLLGMNLYAWGRQRTDRQALAAYLAMSAGIGACTVLAVFSKENGALLPLLLLVFELTVVAAARERVGTLHRGWAALFLYLPCALLVAYFARIALVDDLFRQQPMRGFSQFERLLTESRIVADYLRHLFLPSLVTAGIFQDGIEKSTSLLQPITTLISALFHLALIGGSILLRRRFPVAAFAILFFYCGHLVESTYFNLELYFEHRNYLPALCLFLPPALLVANHVPPRAAIAIAVLAVATLGGLTRFSSAVWASYPSLVATAAAVAPESSRAQQQHAVLLYNAGNVGGALSVTAKALERHPASQDLNVWLLRLLCREGQLSPDQFAQATTAIGTPPYDLRTLSFHEALFGDVAEGLCPEIGATELEALVDAFLMNPVNADPRSPMYAQLTYLKGIAGILDNRPDDAAEQFQRSLESRPGVGRAMKMASLLANYSYFAQAMALANVADSYFRDDRTVGEPTGVTRADVAEFRANVEAELADRALN